MRTRLSVCAQSLQLCPALWDPINCSLPLSPQDFPGKNTGAGCHYLLQGIFWAWGSNSHLLWLLHCRQILYHWATREALDTPWRGNKTPQKSATKGEHLPRGTGDKMQVWGWLCTRDPFIYLFIIVILFFFNFIFKLYNIVLVLPNIKMNPPQVYMCFPSWTLLSPPSPYHLSGSSQCTSPKHPVSCIEPGLAIRFTW